jgi:hypothetical protein
MASDEFMRAWRLMRLRRAIERYRLAVRRLEYTLYIECVTSVSSQNREAK